VGARIWELLADGRSPESVASVVAKEFHAPPKTVAATSRGSSRPSSATSF